MESRTFPGEEGAQKSSELRSSPVAVAGLAPWRFPTIYFRFERQQPPRGVWEQKKSLYHLLRKGLCRYRERHPLPLLLLHTGSCPLVVRSKRSSWVCRKEGWATTQPSIHCVCAGIGNSRSFACGAACCVFSVRSRSWQPLGCEGQDSTFQLPDKWQVHLTQWKK